MTKTKKSRYAIKACKDRLPGETSISSGSTECSAISRTSKDGRHVVAWYAYDFLTICITMHRGILSMISSHPEHSDSAQSSCGLVHIKVMRV